MLGVGEVPRGGKVLEEGWGRAMSAEYIPIDGGSHILLIAAPDLMISSPMRLSVLPL